MIQRHGANAIGVGDKERIVGERQSPHSAEGVSRDRWVLRRKCLLTDEQPGGLPAVEFSRGCEGRAGEPQH
jgi:hypothetical protein